MTEATAAPATDTPRGAITIHEAVALMDANDKAAATATPLPAASAEVVAQADTDTPSEAPDAVEDGAPEPDEDSRQEADEQVEEEATDPEGDYVETEDGEKIPVTELLNSHKRVKDLQARVTRKEQALAEERRTLDSQRKEVTENLTAKLRQAEEVIAASAAKRDEWGQMVQGLSAQLAKQRDAWAGFDWQGLQAQIDAAEASGDEFEANKAWRRFNRERTRYDQHQQNEQAIQAELAKVAREQEAEKADRNAKEAAAERAARDDAQKKFLAHLQGNYADLFNPEKGVKLANAITTTAKNLGYTQAEIDATVDTRGFDLLWKATQYDLLMREKTGVTQRKADGTPAAPADVRIVKGNGSRPRPLTVEKGRMGGTMAAFNTVPSFDNALAALNAQTEYASKRR